MGSIEGWEILDLVRLEWRRGLVPTDRNILRELVYYDDE